MVWVKIKISLLLDTSEMEVYDTSEIADIKILWTSFFRENVYLENEYLYTDYTNDKKNNKKVNSNIDFEWQKLGF